MSLTAESHGFVVRGRFTMPATDGRPAIDSHSWWYGPEHGWGTTWGPLDYSVHVFATKREGQEAVRAAGIGHRRPLVLAVQDAVALEIADTKAKREAAVAAKRTEVAIACTATIRRLRQLQR